MHVLFVTGEYPPLHGGVGAYTAALANALTAQQLQVSVLAPRRVQELSTAIPPQPMAVYPQIKRWGVNIWYEVARFAQQIGADWIHVQYQTAAYAMNGAINFSPPFWRYFSQHRLQIAWTYHDLRVPYLFPKAGDPLRSWVTLRPAHTTDLLIVTNENDRLQLAQNGVVALKIPIGSNIAAYLLSPTERAAQRLRRGYRPEQLVIGYFGFLNRSKGGIALVETLAELVKLGYDAQLLMIGEQVGASDPTNQAYLHLVERTISDLGLRDRVQWTGHEDDAGVSADLGAIDLLLMPYLDGASLRRGTLMAGLAHGCAIVTTFPQGPLPELVDGRDLLYVPPDDAPAAAAALARLANDPALRQRLCEGARRQSQHFTWEAIARTHIQYYQQRKQ